MLPGARGSLLLCLDESPRFKLDIDKVVYILDDDPSKQNNPGLGLWGRVSVIQVTGEAEDTLSTLEHSASQPCPPVRPARNENSNNMEEYEHRQKDHQSTTKRTTSELP